VQPCASLSATLCSKKIKKIKKLKNKKNEKYFVTLCAFFAKLCAPKKSKEPKN
jgi:hypothetical protein